MGDTQPLMTQAIDQIFVSLKHGLVAYIPPPFQPFFSILISAAAIIGVFACLFALTTILERKGLARIQNRYGPNRVGPFGLLQPLADGIKAVTKEDVVPATADFALHFLAPVVLVLPVFLSLAVLPMGANMTAVDLDAGLLFFFAVGASTELAVFMAGWSSRNKYSLLGGMRAIAQMISYELPLILSTVAVAMAAGSLALNDIVAAQAGYSGGFPHWHVFTPWGLAGFVLFVIAALAESNRSPFDLPEGESELIAGYYTEYSGFKFALFFLGEYIGLFAVSGLAATLFLGGYHAPAAWLTWAPSWLWFFGKLLALICLAIWVRGTLPRLRMDQLMGLAWKFMVPLVLVNLVAAALWHYMPAGLARWAVNATLVFGTYGLLGGALYASRGQRRIYRYAE